MLWLDWSLGRGESFRFWLPAREAFLAVILSLRSFSFKPLKPGYTVLLSIGKYSFGMTKPG